MKTYTVTIERGNGQSNTEEVEAISPQGAKRAALQAFEERYERRGEVMTNYRVTRCQYTGIL